MFLLSVRKRLRALAAPAAITILCVANAGGQEMILSTTWNPKLGMGAIYQSVTGASNVEIELSTIGSEVVNGEMAYWVESNTIEIKKVEKYLMVLRAGNHMQPLRTIIQRRGEDPMEQPAQGPMPTIDEIATYAGTDEISTPAGTFQCQHYRQKKGEWDAWFSPKVTPFGLVRIVNNQGTEMVVVELVTDAKDHMTGTIPKVDPAAR
jgi:hypothetical protein